MRNVLKGEQRIHFGPFVLRFSVEENRVYFITFNQHDFAYWITPTTTGDKKSVNLRPIKTPSLKQFIQAKCYSPLPL